MERGYLDNRSSSYVGVSLHRWVLSGTPISGLLHDFLHFPTAFGVGAGLAELGVGAATLLGVAPLGSALAGAGWAAFIWIGESWTVRPYFLTAGPVFLVLWVVMAVHYGARRAGNANVGMIQSGRTPLR